MQHCPEHLTHRCCFTGFPRCYCRCLEQPMSTDGVANESRCLIFRRICVQSICLYAIYYSRTAEYIFINSHVGGVLLVSVTTFQFLSESHTNTGQFTLRSSCGSTLRSKVPHPENSRAENTQPKNFPPTHKGRRSNYGERDRWLRCGCTSRLVSESKFESRW